MNKVTIVMYHYVRELERSSYPRVKGLDTRLFSEQLAYIMKHYAVITMEELMACRASGKQLPHNALLLTFDDGYIDHFTTVFPILGELGIQGSFFPPAKAVIEHQLLDVNKIHFILASVKDPLQLYNDLIALLDENREEYQLRKTEEYINEFAVKGRFDSREIVFVKNMLQRALPEKLRNAIADKLFNAYVGKPQDVFARELYMSIDQLRCMARNGMYIGGHGYDHYWLGHLAPAQQEKEIDLSLAFLKSLGQDTSKWCMNYPYGDYNDSLLGLLSAKGCTVGLTTEVDIADLSRNNPLLLPRLDTNDLPKERDAQPSPWTLKGD